jgi:isopentenyl phosphate kinase
MFTFLKLGGSLITDKDTPRTPRLEVIHRLSDEIAQFMKSNPSVQLVIGHGAGSFAHVPASQYKTRQGVRSQQEWHGFFEVWQEARALNQIVLDAFHHSGVPAISFPPSASITTRDGKVKSWDLAPIQAALSHQLVPVVYGDVIFDETLGGTILSTEELFMHMAVHLHPQRILLAGLNSVCSDFPTCKQTIEFITDANFEDYLPILGGSASTDVTGGMVQKVTVMLNLTHQVPGLEIQIFSSSHPGVLLDVLQGKNIGTIIH